MTVGRSTGHVLRGDDAARAGLVFDEHRLTKAVCQAAADGADDGVCTSSGGAGTTMVIGLIGKADATPQSAARANPAMEWKAKGFMVGPSYLGTRFYDRFSVALRPANLQYRNLERRSPVLAVRTDNGPEFTSRAFMAWAHATALPTSSTACARPGTRVLRRLFRERGRIARPGAVQQADSPPVAAGELDGGRQGFVRRRAAVNGNHDAVESEDGRAFC